MPAPLSQQFYVHGSPNRIPTGEEVLPASKVSTPEHIANRNSNNRDYQPNRVYMTPQPIAALQYTWTDEDILNKNKQPSGYIHVVEPIGQLRRDTSSQGAIFAGAKHARGARVVGSFPAKGLITGQVDTQEEADAYENYLKHLESRNK
jgi:hypothetical protein